MHSGYFPEKWDLMNRGIDPETGFPICHVRRQNLGAEKRATVWKLVQYPNGWRNVGQFLPGFPGFRPCLERKGVKLSNSRLDLILRSYAETSHGHAFA